MRAIRYHGPRKPLQLEQIATPAPGPGDVLVRVSAAGVCHTELHFLSGLLDLGVAPLTLGHEIVGRVEAVGEGVPRERVGERVILYYYAGCGRCPHCLRGDENLCDALRAEHGFVTDGGFAEYVRVPARNAVPLPDAIGDAEAAPIGCGVTTAVHAANLAGVGLGDWVVVFGVGAVGYGLVQVARLRGARVIAVGRTPEKLERARALGAEATVRAGVEDVAARLRELTGGRGADVVFELVATRETMAASSRALAKRGRLVFVGYSEDTFEIHPIQLVVGEQVVTASVGNTLAELQAAVELVAAGRVKTVVDRVLPLERFQEGIDALAAGRLVGRAVLAP
ncbi:alcohol dehydrogenase catalytic domain-containing protein [Anaeromyxobacter sp. Fw109-5]|uniref:alcohol dehydrogenase catalytic domain-containing protein n=1 Tax=Anaeromyxobacter sp. (strain Fw109-5) TaxID=404589 RepID=UPI0000ED8B40|nr:alcohol dehydrogenase catalytic domain-containing protein [Anaeromyxobacter sp. Fw109-5]ABS27261.1 Alcohol dehydrogenase GroES domain protein [Anaeromyxobacter sp. Fw109-5]